MFWAGQIWVNGKDRELMEVEGWLWGRDPDIRTVCDSVGMSSSNVFHKPQATALFLQRGNHICYGVLRNWIISCLDRECHFTMGLGALCTVYTYAHYVQCIHMRIMYSRQLSNGLFRGSCGLHWAPTPETCNACDILYNVVHPEGHQCTAVNKKDKIWNMLQNSSKLPSSDLIQCPLVSWPRQTHSLRVPYVHGL